MKKKKNISNEVDEENDKKVSHSIYYQLIINTIRSKR